MTTYTFDVIAWADVRSKFQVLMNGNYGVAGIAGSDNVTADALFGADHWIASQHHPYDYERLSDKINAKWAKTHGTYTPEEIYPTVRDQVDNLSNLRLASMVGGLIDGILGKDTVDEAVTTAKGA